MISEYNEIRVKPLTNLLEISKQVIQKWKVMVCEYQEYKDAYQKVKDN